MIKEQGHGRVAKKIECNIHGKRIKYKCMNSSCRSPYLCAESECIDHHFHDDASLICTKFDSNEWQSKLRQVQLALSNPNLEAKQEYLTKIVTCFTSSLHKIHQQMNELHQIKQEIRQSESRLLIPSSLERFLTLGKKVEKRIDHLRSKIIDEDSYFLNKYSKMASKEIYKRSQASHKPTQIVKNEEDANDTSNQNNSFINQLRNNKPSNFHNDNNLKAHLNSLIHHFQWHQTQTIFNSFLSLPNCRKFHDELKDRKNLLFLFIGENEVIGSYYSIAYPSLEEKTKKDANSFIFIYSKDLNNKFTAFLANKTSEYHLTVSQKLLICQGNTSNCGDGIRTFKRNFQSLSYYLPSKSYCQTNSKQEMAMAYSGVLRIKQFHILEVNIE